MSAPSPLRGRGFLPGYRSGRDDLARELFGAALDKASTYRRAAGFFASSVFGVLGSGFASFFKRGGRMTLVTSTVFEPADVAAIQRDYADRGVLAHPTVDAICQALDSGSCNTAAILGAALRLGLIQVYIARPKASVRHAIYHEKFGLFGDGRSMVAFSGSGNESGLALVGSFERHEVFCSWGDASERCVVETMDRQFDLLVRNETAGIEVRPLLEAYREGWLERRMKSGGNDTDGGTEAVSVTEPEHLVQFSFPLFEHQKVARREWARAGGRGLLAMATGSGKTITSLSIASSLFDALEDKWLCIVIVAPFIHLVDQWIEVAAGVGLAPVRCAEGSAKWQDELSTAIYALNARSRRILSIATTSATLQSSTFQEQLRRIRAPMLVIGDEAHNYGSTRMAACLPQAAAYRVGLSATPEKWMDPDGTARILDYFGSIVHRYGLAEALDDEVLTPYLYHPTLVALEPDEAEKYEEYTAKLAKFGITDDASDLSEGAKALLLKRARLLASARGKLPVLMNLLEARRNDTHMLIYCGDGRPEAGEDEMPARQIEDVVAMAEDLGIICALYTAETPPDRRRVILQDFDAGRIQALVAIRCLDEGVDVPSTRTAFILSSSTNPRQFVQRRGRVLRRSPATGKVRAEIFDFFMVPDASSTGGYISNAMAGVVRKQLDRMMEFSTLALNGPRARKELLGWTERHGLMGLWGR
ncbi:MAG TPA: DEAD/DEAH box helicase family protein [Polyangia bacterium]